MIENNVKPILKSNPKPKTKSNPNWAWRPTVVTEMVVAKLEEWFSYWFTDLEACLYANISKDALYDYCKKFPEFTDRKELLKDQPKMNARAVVAKKIKDWDDYNSRWYLERKWKDEFSTKEIIDQTTKQVNYSKEEWDNISDDELDNIITWN